MVVCHIIFIHSTDCIAAICDLSIWHPKIVLRILYFINAAPQYLAGAAMPKSLRSKGHKALIAVLVGSRKAADLRQADLARKVGWPQSIVSRIESGERRMDLVEFVQWAKAVKEDPVDLFARFARW